MSELISGKIISSQIKEELRNEIDKMVGEGKKSVLLLILRNGARRFVALSLTD